MKIILVLLAFLSAEDLNARIHKIAKEKEINSIYGVYTVNDKNEPEFLARGITDYSKDLQSPYICLDTQSFIFSCTKQMTTILILKLIEEKKIKLHDKIIKVLGKKYKLWNKKPPLWAYELTVYQLLTHTTGFFDYVYDPFFIMSVSKKNTTRDKYQKAVLDSAARFQFIGKKKEGLYEHSYINTNFFILGLIIEHCYNDSLSNVYKKYIFEPLGMQNTILLEYGKNQDLLKLNMNKKSIVYSPTSNPWYFKLLELFFSWDLDNYLQVDLFSHLKDKHINKFMLFSDGGVISTFDDMIKFLIGLHKDLRILSKEMRELMFSPHEVALSTLYGSAYDSCFYGLGTQIRYYNHSSIYGHAGNFAGYRFEGLYLKKQNIFIILFGNQAILPTYKPGIGYVSVLKERKYDIKYIVEDCLLDYFIYDSKYNHRDKKF